MVAHFLALPNTNCGDQICNQTAGENCTSCPEDCLCSGWKLHDIANPTIPLSATNNSLTTGIVCRSRSNLLGWEGCPAGNITANRTYANLTTSNCQLLFDYSTVYDLSMATQDRIMQVVLIPESGCGVGRTVTYTVVKAAAGTTQSVNSTYSINLGAWNGQAVTVSFQWTVPECMSGPANFQVKRIQMLIIILLTTLDIRTESCKPTSCKTALISANGSATIMTCSWLIALCFFLMLLQ
jgi:hypothetical protein